MSPGTPQMDRTADVIGELRRRRDQLLDDLVKAATAVKIAEEEVQLYRQRREELQRQYSDVLIELRDEGEV